MTNPIRTPPFFFWISANENSNQLKWMTTGFWLPKFCVSSPILWHKDVTARFPLCEDSISPNGESLPEAITENFLRLNTELLLAINDSVCFGTDCVTLPCVGWCTSWRPLDPGHREAGSKNFTHPNVTRCWLRYDAIIDILMGLVRT